MLDLAMGHFDCDSTQRTQFETVAEGADERIGAFDGTGFGSYPKQGKTNVQLLPGSIGGQCERRRRSGGDA
jgi:hypothetical protein